MSLDFVAERLSHSNFSQVKELDCPQCSISAVDLGDGQLFQYLRRYWVLSPCTNKLLFQCLLRNVIRIADLWNVTFCCWPMGKFRKWLELKISIAPLTYCRHNCVWHRVTCWHKCCSFDGVSVLHHIAYNLCADYIHCFNIILLLLNFPRV